MKASGRIIAQRQQKILDFLQSNSAARVTELSESLGVSDITIRRDLDFFFEAGLVERFHGGARLIQKAAPEFKFEIKGSLHSAEKEAIGERAADLVKDGDTVFVNAGSTTLSLLKHLSERRVRVITNNAAAPNVIEESAMELILVGGEYRHTSRSLFGDLAVATISQIHANLCVLGTNGISVRHGLTTSVYPEAAINRLMVERCIGAVIVVADGTKVGAVSNFTSLPLSAVKTLVTDESADPAELRAIADTGVEVIVVQAPPR
ncbi:MAG: DeoR/GlpR family DNA-binding transcription regulator [Treponemataceae bacterium]